MENKVRFHIKEYAQEQGMRLGELARRLRMPLSNLSAIASGQRSVSIQLLSRIAKLLNCRVSELFVEKVITDVIYRNDDANREILKIAEQNYPGIETDIGAKKEITGDIQERLEKLLAEFKMQFKEDPL